MNSEWTRAERLAFYSLLVAIIGVLVALFIPELRVRLGLNPERVSLSPSNSISDNTSSNSSNVRVNPTSVISPTPVPNPSPDRSKEATIPPKFTDPPKPPRMVAWNRPADEEENKKLDNRIAAYNALVNSFYKNYKTNPEVAYQAATELIRKYPDDAYSKHVKTYIEEYKKWKRMNNQ